MTTNNVASVSKPQTIYMETLRSCHRALICSTYEVVLMKYIHVCMYVYIDIDVAVVVLTKCTSESLYYYEKVWVNVLHSWLTILSHPRSPALSKHLVLVK